LAIWKIELDSSNHWAFNQGNMRLNSADDANVVALASSMLSSLTGNGPQLRNLFALTRIGGQDILIQIPSNGIPERGTMGMMALGGLAVLAIGRKRRLR
jgi:hypothetical protein